jgi:hypothetical protein
MTENNRRQMVEVGPNIEDELSSHPRQKMSNA